jgi:structural maintenance of chromosome 2
MSEAKEKFKELEEQQKGLKKKINPKVINMIDTCVVILHDGSII